MRDDVKRYNLNALCLVETEVKAEKALCTKDCIVPDWGFINSYDCHELGRSGFDGIVMLLR